MIVAVAVGSADISSHRMAGVADRCRGTKSWWIALGTFNDYVTNLLELLKWCGLLRLEALPYFLCDREYISRLLSKRPL